MKKILIGIIFSAIGLMILFGCASLQTFLSGSTTNLTSSSLAAASALRAQGITIAGTREGNNWLETPTKISGKILSIVLPVNGQEDEGIVPFGSGRPDIAPAQSTLYDFDLSQVTALHSPCISLKPGYTGGTCSQILMMFGYFDVEFTQGSTAKKIRFVYGATTPYERGDKLIYNPNGATTNQYYWYSSVEGFVIETATRPADAAVNTFVRDFSDPVRPVMHYYLLGAQLRNNTDYDGEVRNTISLVKNNVEDRVLTFTVNFDVQSCVVFTDVASEAAFQALTDAELIQKFDMKQNVSQWQSSNLYCSISFESRSKY
ncbi:MAG: hypothetical protein QME05_01610 [Candidatus Margulisbacteria bacterium]|nr:hypothetical protein [Candidatus Margulisiibacteriota bacterium]